MIMEIKLRKIGILGGGQLAQMMVLKSHELGFETFILSQKKNDPAALACHNHIIGQFNKISDVKKIVEKVDVLTFESEFVSSDVLLWLDQNYKKKVFPNPKLMSHLADRLFQKKTLKKFNLPQSDFFDFYGYEEFLKKSVSRKLPLVLKKRKEGYDGKGTYIVKSLSEKKLKTFIESSTEGFIAEDFIPFKRELAITFSRTSGHTVHVFPVVETKQTDYRCDWVKGPIAHPKIKSFITKVKEFLNKNNYIGVIAFELFDTEKDILINEIAPRVHNSSHYTMNACEHGQFEAHLRAILRIKELNPKPVVKAFAMANLIGNGKSSFKLKTPEQGHLHWYNKSENVKGRKMGHINTYGSTPEKALQLALQMREKVMS